ncbi:hypothetical protein Y032_0048g1566 [Ancylostoma ceylanicum]|uniref:Uncharacterized protein n=1 Tax=Ancylostoma ceylanicum TaxID=53326 RepID=A0A016UAS1_9BILA|nr:hypothetical protein Y032_0048g1566 [Ancylostoma ceylanicum]
MEERLISSCSGFTLPTFQHKLFDGPKPPPDQKFDRALFNLLVCLGYGIVSAQELETTSCGGFGNVLAPLASR